MKLFLEKKRNWISLAVAFGLVASSAFAQTAPPKKKKKKADTSATEPKQSAESSAISGHPLISIVQLCELLARRDRALPAGSIVMAGAATVAEVLKSGDKFELTVEGLGSVSVTAG